MIKIMIVEDSKFAISIIKGMIQRFNSEIQIIEADNGQEGIDMYKKEHPDLVLMDISMPVMNGIESLEGIKKFDPNAKVVMCTSLKEPEQEERAKNAGCVGYIEKPFSKDDILNAVQDHLNESGKTPKDDAPKELTPEIIQFLEENGIDATHLKERSDFDNLYKYIKVAMKNKKQ